VGLVGVFAACSYEGAVTQKDPTADERHAAEAMAAARCDRQTPACVSPSNPPFDTRDACIDAKAAKSVVEARLAHCGCYSLNEGRLRRCVGEIRQGQCGTGIAKLDDCRGAKVCPYETEEGSASNDTNDGVAPQASLALGPRNALLE